MSRFFFSDASGNESDRAGDHDGRDPAALGFQLPRLQERHFFLEG